MSRTLCLAIHGKVLLKRLLYCTSLAHAAEVARLTSLICKEIEHEESDKIFRLRLLPKTSDSDSDSATLVTRADLLTVQAARKQLVSEPSGHFFLSFYFYVYLPNLSHYHY